MESGLERRDARDSDTTLTRYRKHFSDYVDNSQTERQEAELHRDYFDGKQWTADERATLEARGQPVITDNKIKDKIEYMEGVERKTRTDPKAFPRTPKHEQDADVATDCLRYVFDRNRFGQIKSAVFQNLLVEGFGGCEVIVDKAKPKDVLIRKLRWDRIYRDPYSMEPDCSDATYVGFITWMDFEKAKSKWPKSKDIVEMGPARNAGETQDDKPRWIDAKRRRSQIFEHYEKRDGKVYRSVFCWGGFLEEPALCPYKNDDDEHEWPLILASAYIDRDGKRYGLVQRYVSLQDEVNKRRSKSLHAINSKRVIADQGAVADVEKARKEVHKPDGYIEKQPGMEFEVQENFELSAAHFQLLQQAENALSITGPNAALLGQSGSISGRAKELDQQGGAVQVSVLFDNIRDWQLRVARAVWARIRQYWDEEMFIRVTDDENGLKFVAINQRVTQGDQAAEQFKQDPEFQGLPPPEKERVIQNMAQDPAMQAPAVGPDGKPVMKNAVSELDVDIIIDESPDAITIQAEEFQKLAELAKSGIPIPPDALIEASQIRNKKQILDKMSGANDPNAAAMQEMQKTMQELTARMQAAEVALKEAQVDKTDAEADKIRQDMVAAHVNAATSVAQASTPEPMPEPALN